MFDRMISLIHQEKMKQQQEQEMKKKLSLFQELPSELIRIIISYYTNEWNGLMKLATICHGWKLETDSSLIWCRHDYFTFYAPKKYFEIFYLSESYETHKQTHFIHNETLIYFFDDQFIAFPSNNYKIFFYRTNRSHSQSPEDDDQIIIRNEIPSVERAIEIRKKFLHLFVEFHRLWDWYSKWILYLQPIQARLVKLRDITFTLVFFFIALILMGLAAYLLSDLPNYPTSLSIPNHFGFACLYLNGLIYFLMFLLDLPAVILLVLKYPKNSDMKRKLEESPFFALVLYESSILSILCSLIMLEYQFSNNIHSYQYLSIPSWICCFIAWFSAWIFYRSEFGTWKFWAVVFFLAIFIFSFPLAYTLGTLYYASSTSISQQVSSLWSAMAPLIPFELFLFIISLLSIYDFLAYLKRFCFSVSNLSGLPSSSAMDLKVFYGIPKTYLQLFAITGKMITTCGMLVIIITINVLLTMNMMKLSWIFLLFISFFICFQCSSFFAFYILPLLNNNNQQHPV